MKKILFLFVFYMAGVFAQNSLMDVANGKMQNCLMTAKFYLAKFIVLVEEKRVQLQTFCNKHEDAIDTLAVASTTAAAVYLSAKYWWHKKEASNNSSARLQSNNASTSNENAGQSIVSLSSLFTCISEWFVDKCRNYSVQSDDLFIGSEY